MESKANPEPLFREVQQFRQSYLWAGILAAAAFGWFRFFRSLRSRGSIWAAFRWLPQALWLPWLFYSAKLVTEVRANQIRVEFSSSILQIVDLMSLDELQRHEPVEYRPFSEFAGWGLRWNPVKGWAYTVSGNAGVRVELQNGKRLLIGSQRPDELNSAITQAASDGSL